VFESPAEPPSTLTSVGIDVGTTTTHVIVSELAIDSAGVSGTKKLAIGDRTVRFRGPIHETPLVDPETVDIDATAELIAADLDTAGVAPENIDTGAVIVTGETARTANAELLAHHLADEAVASSSPPPAQPLRQSWPDKGPARPPTQPSRKQPLPTSTSAAARPIP